MTFLKSMLIAGAGGFFGTCCRFAINKLFGTLAVLPFPLATFIANVAGCLLFGLFTGLLSRANMLSSGQALLLITGFCGGLTTFSTFSGEIVNIGSKGDMASAALYLCASVVTGLFAVWLGRMIGES